MNACLWFLIFFCLPCKIQKNCDLIAYKMRWMLVSKVFPRTKYLSCIHVSIFENKMLTFFCQIIQNKFYSWIRSQPCRKQWQYFSSRMSNPFGWVRWQRVLTEHNMLAAFTNRHQGKISKSDLNSNLLKRVNWF